MMKRIVNRIFQADGYSSKAKTYSLSKSIKPPKSPEKATDYLLPTLYLNYKTELDFANKKY
ncbi:MAG: hypothetical protein EAY68_03145 [Bacteroidetes bacterium]|nr:MAG: hypothetical protein EAY68_03145 [Bacteroidota bacterium]